MLHFPQNPTLTALNLELQNKMLFVVFSSKRSHYSHETKTRGADNILGEKRPPEGLGGKLLIPAATLNNSSASSEYKPRARPSKKFIRRSEVFCVSMLLDFLYSFINLSCCFWQTLNIYVQHETVYSPL